MVHWGPYLQASCHALLHHDNIGASIPSLHPFVYFSEALPVTFYNLCPLLQGHLWVRVEHLSLPQVLRGPTLAIQFLVTPGNCSVLDANLLWEEQQSFRASWCDGREARDAGWHPGILVLTIHRQEQCADPGQHARHWNHRLWEPGPRRIEFGIVSRVGDARTVSVLPWS